MAGETLVTVIGNLTDDPDLRFTPSGSAVSNFTVASTPRVFDKQSQEWRDGETLFMRCSIWRQAAENVAESLRKGDRVIVSGRLKQRSFEDREGVSRTVVECEADEVAASLKFRLIPHGAGRAERRSEPVEGDPWASGQGPSGGGATDEPPF